jgi:hypothetical protein
MNITRDVITDLWPVYEAGEASADTRALVEAFLRDDPELGRLLRAEGPGLPVAAPALRLDADRVILARTQRLIRRRKWLLGLALFFTMLPGSSAHTETLTFMLWRDLPAVAVASVAVAVALWTAYVVAGRRLKISGF